ncbi:L-seryl-tRNA(Sec) selenium transferase, partial [Xenorhabdus bovienii]|nr:L-seryl-tRNA(Sec) selenium transferase [Xenorhabdus bovienii]
MTQEINSLYRQLPSIDKLLRESEITPLIEMHGQTRVVGILREMQELARINIREHQHLPEWNGNWVASLHQRI